MSSLQVKYYKSSEQISGHFTLENQLFFTSSAFWAYTGYGNGMDSSGAEQRKIRRLKAPAATAVDDLTDVEGEVETLFSEVKEPGGDGGAKDLKARINKLEEELQQMRTGGILADSAFLATLSSEERAEVANVLQKRIVGKSQKSDASATSASPDAPTATSVKVAAPREQRVYIQRLNGWLKQAEKGGSGPENRKQMWRWYMRCRQNIPTFRAQISKATWATLWDAQAVSDPSNPDRAAHLKVLAEDMNVGGHELTPTQKLAYIEALFIEGHKSKALEEWDADEEILGHIKGVDQDFRALGVRMFAAQGDPGRAQEIARSLLAGQGSKDFRILIPIISAWNKVGGVSGFKHAWALYMRLREGLRSTVTMEDFDAVSKSFLEAGKADLALGVFKDMMLTRQPGTGLDSSALYRKAMGTFSDIRNLTIEAPEINRVSLDAMSVLPASFQNKFFYGSWIKKLLGAHEPDSAILVAELMTKRGIQPDSKYLNGIIGAWIRQGDAESCDKAEKLAWKMIERRKREAWDRRAKRRREEGAVMEPGSEGESTDEPMLEAHPYARAATLETFCILVEYYLKRDNHDQIRWLNRSLRLADIQPSAFFMNHLMYSQEKIQGPRKVWETFSEWTQRRDCVKADVETFACLWDCVLQRGARVRDGDADQAEGREPAISDNSEHDTGLEATTGIDAGGRRESGFPSARHLFARMISWNLESSPEQQRVHREAFSRKLYHLIICCFFQGLSGSGDVKGGLVAMFGLRDAFGVFPDEHTAKVIVMRLARGGRPVGRRGRTDREREVRKISQLLERLAERRIEYLEGQSIGVGRVDEGFRAEENLYLLAELIRTVQSKGSDVAELEHSLERAAWDMGVGGMHMGDHLLQPGRS
ncbi:MAG: hypothetical protein M1832_001815 [Thelocarpon impressellum]|nr:MAG: hypothetical protein M1832_001815 [Thelocarpon impressellum]